MTASATSGKPLLEADLKKTIDACDRALSLDFAKKKILKFFESRMGYYAPNLSAIVGSDVAVKLIGAAGGLSDLANMTCDVVYGIGAKKRILAGFSSATSQLHVGFVEQTRISKSTPPSSRKKAWELLAAKSVLASRMDDSRQDPAGRYGRALRDMIHKKIDKWQDRKRGGSRLRKMKERYNREKKNAVWSTRLGDGYGEGHGIRPGSKQSRLG
ncbi:U4/U6 small nuclear ribonucleoprotein Prp31-like protein [Thalictrum thalictroides]|uniref:U4/U6 small nuclear ribonucleoprotein Prp31-like protein n=1 Tax=Thalictrum thalictroides TaxID=46969 RepID=A0A7J6WK87_THATH|nr:U4/U6 small nuclear ribonucleoprotein Prp31-like protein [Thalictrum thalictroides]